MCLNGRSASVWHWANKTKNKSGPSPIPSLNNPSPALPQNPLAKVKSEPTLGDFWHQQYLSLCTWPPRLPLRLTVIPHLSVGDADHPLLVATPHGHSFFSILHLMTPAEVRLLRVARWLVHFSVRRSRLYRRSLSRCYMYTAVKARECWSKYLFKLKGILQEPSNSQFDIL